MIINYFHRQKSRHDHHHHVRHHLSRRLDCIFLPLSDGQMATRAVQGYVSDTWLCCMTPGTHAPSALTLTPASFESCFQFSHPSSNFRILAARYRHLSPSRMASEQTLRDRSPGRNGEIFPPNTLDSCLVILERVLYTGPICPSEVLSIDILPGNTRATAWTFSFPPASAWPVALNPQQYDCRSRIVDARKLHMVGPPIRRSERQARYFWQVENGSWAHLQKG